MATVLTRVEKRLIFDGDCPMCRATVAMLLRMGLVRPEQTVSSHDLDAADRVVAEAAGLHNELVVLEPATRETRSGADGLLWIIGDNTRLFGLVRLLGLPGFRQLLRYGYQTVSYNRRIISPPRHRIVCDCEPEVTLMRRMSLVVLAGVPALILWGLFGAAAFVGGKLGGAFEGVVVAGAVVGAACLVLSVVAMVLLKAETAVDYIGHLSVTAFLGALVLVPGIVAMAISRPKVAILVAIVSLVVSAAVMFKTQRRRMAALGVSRAWSYAWAGAFGAAIVGAVYYLARG